MQLPSYASALLNLATIQGVSLSNPIVYKVTVGSDRHIIVSYNEPYNLVLPLNVAWLLADPTSGNYGKIFRRQSKEAGSGFIQTWTEITSYDDLMNTNQYYDAADTPQPVIVSLTGGQLTQPLLPRVSSTYDSKEVIPQSVLDQKMASFRQSQLVMYSNMNNRELFDDKRIRELMNRVLLLETGASGTFTHIQELESDTWVINHGLNTMSPGITLWVNKETILCDTIEAIDENNVLVSFSLPLSGAAHLSK